MTQKQHTFHTVSYRQNNHINTDLFDEQKYINPDETITMTYDSPLYRLITHQNSKAAPKLPIIHNVSNDPNTPDMSFVRSAHPYQPVDRIEIHAKQPLSAKKQNLIDEYKRTMEHLANKDRSDLLHYNQSRTTYHHNTFAPRQYNRNNDGTSTSVYDSTHYQLQINQNRNIGEDTFIVTTYDSQKTPAILLTQDPDRERPALIAVVETHTDNTYSDAVLEEAEKIAQSIQYIANDQNQGTIVCTECAVVNVFPEIYDSCKCPNCDNAVCIDCLIDYEYCPQCESNRYEDEYED